MTYNVKLSHSDKSRAKMFNAYCMMDDELLQILQQLDPDGLCQPGPLGRLKMQEILQRKEVTP